MVHKYLDILTEATRRSLQNNMLADDMPLNVPQVEALTAYLNELENHPNLLRAYFDMATGTGKTGVFSILTKHARAVAKETGFGDKFRIIIVEPTVLLLEQTRQKLLWTAPELANEIGICGDGSKDISKPITIITYDAWLELAEKGKLGNVALEINDEAHNSLSERRQALINKRLQDAVHLGFTATAAYDDEKTLERTHKNLIYKLSLADAVRRNFLTDYIHVQYAEMPILPTVLGEGTKTLSGKEYNALQRREWSRFITRAYATMPDGFSGEPLSDKVATFFAADTRHADAIAAMLNQNPILRKKAQDNGFRDVAIPIHTVRMSSKEQKQRLLDFENGLYMAAVGDDKFKAGFDYPRVKFIASYPRASLVNTAQEIGRGARPYADPLTGIPQGTTVFEVLPYVASNNPDKDEEAWRAALKKYVTAKDILGGATLVSPNARSRYLGKAPVLIGKKKRRTVTLSPHVMVEVYLTEEETLTINSEINAALARAPRIELTEALREALKAKIALRGNPGSRKMVQAIERYEQNHNLPSTDISANHIEVFLNSPFHKTADAAQWQRLHEVLDALSEEYVRIEITPTRLEALRKTIAEKGGFGSHRLYKAIERYEAEKKLTPIDMSQNTLQSLLTGVMKTIEKDRWERLNDTLTWLPVIENTARVEFTTSMVEELRAGLKLFGNYHPAGLLIKEIEHYEATNKVAQSNITNGTVKNYLAGKAQTIPAIHWERLKEIFSLAQKGEVGSRVELTPEITEDLQNKISKRGDYSQARLSKEIEKYEAAKNLPKANITEHALRAMLAGVGQTILKSQLERLYQVLESIPLGGYEPSVSPTNAEWKIFAQKIKTKGNYSAGKLLDAIERYENENQLDHTELKERYVYSIIHGDLRMIDAAHWKLINDTLDALPNGGLEPRLNLTVALAKELRSEIVKRGSYSRTRLASEIERYEHEHQLASLGISGFQLTSILGRNMKTVSELQWKRIIQAIKSIPEGGFEQKIKLTKGDFKALATKLATQGNLGPHQLMSKISQFEEEKELESVGLTGSLIRELFDRTKNTVTRPQWSRINDALDVLAENPRTVITEELRETLLTKIKLRGDFGSHLLLKAVKKYEAEQKLDSSGLTQNNIEGMINGDSKVVDTSKWDRLQHTLNDLPSVEVALRIDITTKLHEEFLSKIKARGDFGSSLLYQAVQKYEAQHKLPSTGLTQSNIDDALRRDAKSMEAKRWWRLNDSIDALPEVESRPRIALTPKMIKDINARIKANGGYGSPKLFRAVVSYETFNQLLSTGLTQGLIGKAIAGAMNTLDALQWKRLNEVVDQLSTIKLIPDIKNSVIIPQQVLKTLETDVETFFTELDTDMVTGMSHSVVLDYVHEWLNEPEEIKLDQNKLTQRLYKTEKSKIEKMLSFGLNVQQMSIALNRQKGSTYQDFKWEPKYLLRGAVLTQSALPLHAFSLARTNGRNRQRKAAQQPRLGG